MNLSNYKLTRDQKFVCTFSHGNDDYLKFVCNPLFFHLVHDHEQLNEQPQTLLQHHTTAFVHLQLLCYPDINTINKILQRKFKTYP